MRVIRVGGYDRVEPYLDGLPELHALLEPGPLEALVEADVEAAQGQANALNGWPVFLEALAVQPRSLEDTALVGAVLRAEAESGVRWAA